jgi:UDP-glucuronate 4-epimerase
MSIIFITGVAGFIGSQLADKLLALGHTIVGLDNFNSCYDPHLKERNIKNAFENPRFMLIRGNLLDQEKIGSIFQQYSFDAVFHLAAKAGVRPSLENPVGYYRANVEGTIILLEACKMYRVTKFFFASSSSVYGNNHKVPFSEEDNVDFPISPYAASKRSGELICYNYYHHYGINTFGFRFFTVYGPRQRPDMAIHKFTRLIAAKESLPLYDAGRLRRDFTFIDDIIQGMVNALDVIKGFEIINLGESRVVEINEMVCILERHLNMKAHRTVLNKPSGDVDITYADIRKAQRILHYQPATDIEEGIKRFIQWYLAEAGSLATSETEASSSYV